MMDKILSLNGFMGEVDCRLLYDLAFKTTDNVIVELGSNRGKSTCCLAYGTMDAGRNLPVFAIDAHGDFFSNDHSGGWVPEDRMEFFQNISALGASRVVRLLNMDSFKIFKAWGRPISLLFIDADHKYENVSRDFWNWEYHVKVGGIIVLHDSNMPGVDAVIKSAITSMDLTEPRFRKIGEAGTATVLEKIVGRLE